MKKKLIIIFIVLTIIVTTNVAISFAVTQSDLSDVKDEINETKNQMADVEEELTELLKQVKSINAEIQSYQDEIDDLEGQVSKLEEKIEETEEKLKEAEEEYDRQQYLLESRLVALYEAGETTFLDVLLSSDGITDFITNYYLVSEIAEYDTELLSQMEKNKNAIEETKTELENSKKEIEELKNSKEEKANALKKSKNTKQTYVDKLSDEEKELQKQLEKLEAEQREIENQLKKAENKYSGEIANLGGNGTLQKPVKSGVITATWYYPSGGFHGALDYGIPEGTKVYAAAEGVVLYAGWSNGGYGYYVCLQHANGMRTYYAHGNGTIYVSEGKTVSKGQLIMLSGNTGNSTGPHLHFEVRVSPYNWSYGGNDSRRDPRNYL